MSTQSVTASSKPPLGTGGDLRSRLRFHHLPLALVSAVVLVLFMTFPRFDITPYLHADIFSGTLPQGGQHGSMQHGGESQMGSMHHGGHHARSENHNGPNSEQIRHRNFTPQLVVATGYVALGLIAFTLLIGPANLLLRRRAPVSNYLSRDVGTWAAVFSLVHLIVAWAAHASGSGVIAAFLHFFVAPDGSLLTNSFGLGTGPAWLR